MAAPRRSTLIATLTIAFLLFVFGLIAQEIAGGEASFDRQLLLALRDPANPTLPIGPAWLQEAARDVTSLGSIVVLVLVTLAAAGYLFLARACCRLADACCRVRRHRSDRSAQGSVCAATSGFCGSRGAGLYREFPKRTRITIGNHLFDYGSSSGPDPNVKGDQALHHHAGRFSDRADRRQPNISWCSLSNRCSRGLDYRYSVGDRMLGDSGATPT